MHKEAPLTKTQKEDIRARNMHDRDIFDANNLGGFRRSFPNENCVSIATTYTACVVNYSLLICDNDATRTCKRSTNSCWRSPRRSGTSSLMESSLRSHRPRPTAALTITSTADPHSLRRPILSATTRRRRLTWRVRTRSSRPSSTGSTTINTRTGSVTSISTRNLRNSARLIAIICRRRSQLQPVLQRAPLPATMRSLCLTARSRHLATPVAISMSALR